MSVSRVSFLSFLFFEEHEIENCCTDPLRHILPYVTHCTVHTSSVGAVHRASPPLSSVTVESGTRVAHVRNEGKHPVAARTDLLLSRTSWASSTGSAVHP